MMKYTASRIFLGIFLVVNWIFAILGSVFGVVQGVPGAVLLIVPLAGASHALIIAVCAIFDCAEQLSESGLRQAETNAKLSKLIMMQDKKSVKMRSPVADLSPDVEKAYQDLLAADRVALKR